MSESDTSKELKKLRAEVAALSKAQKASARASTEPAAVEGEGDGDESLLSEAIGLGKDQFEELATLLEEEIRDLPTVTCLTIFALGVLMGRMMR